MHDAVAELAKVATKADAWPVLSLAEPPPQQADGGASKAQVTAKPPAPPVAGHEQQRAECGEAIQVMKSTALEMKALHHALMNKSVALHAHYDAEVVLHGRAAVRPT